MKARAWPIILLISVLAAGCGDEAYLELKNNAREPVMVKKETRGDEGYGSFKIIAGGATKEYLLDTYERDVAISVTVLPSSQYLEELHALRGELMLKQEAGVGKLTGKELRELQDYIMALQKRLDALLQAKPGARNKCTIWYEVSSCGYTDYISGRGSATIEQKPDGTFEVTCKDPERPGSQKPPE